MATSRPPAKARVPGQGPTSGKGSAHSKSRPGTQSQASDSGPPAHRSRRRPLANSRMLMGATPDDIPPLHDADDVWRIVGCHSKEGKRENVEALVTRLRALGLVALDTAASIESTRETQDGAATWYTSVGSDLVERAAEALGVHHARRAKVAREDIRELVRLVTALRRIEDELKDLRLFVSASITVPQRIPRDRLPAIREATRKALAKRSEPTPKSWTLCIKDGADNHAVDSFEAVLRGDLKKVAVRQVVSSEDVTREKIYAAQRWCKKTWPSGIPDVGRFVPRLALLGPPRG